MYLKHEVNSAYVVNNCCRAEQGGDIKLATLFKAQRICPVWFNTGWDILIITRTVGVGTDALVVVLVTACTEPKDLGWEGNGISISHTVRKINTSPCCGCLKSREKCFQAEEDLLAESEVWCTDNAVQHSLMDSQDGIGCCWRSNNLLEPYLLLKAHRTCIYLWKESIVKLILSLHPKKEKTGLSDLWPAFTSTQVVV